MADLEKTESLELNKPAEGDIDWHTPLNENWDILDSWLVGMVLPFAGKKVPKGFLLCDGRAVSREDYKRLFDAIGTTYGEGDKSKTFNVPDFRDRTFWGGTEAGKKVEAGLPNIKGDFQAMQFTEALSASGAFRADGAGKVHSGSAHTHSADTAGKVSFDASRSNAIYGKSSTVQPPAYKVMMCIKY
jgi:microcystin-dependent protein